MLLLQLAFIERHRRIIFVVRSGDCMFKEENQVFYIILLNCIKQDGGTRGKGSAKKDLLTPTKNIL